MITVSVIEKIREQFEDWMKNELSKRNTVHITADVYSSIVKCLKDLNSNRDVSSYPRKIQKKVKRDYRLMNYPKLGLIDVLYISTNDKNVSHFFIFFISVLTVNFSYHFLKYFCNIVKFIFQGCRNREVRSAPPISRIFFFFSILYKIGNLSLFNEKATREKKSR